MKRKNKNAAVHVCDGRNSFVVILLKTPGKCVFLM